MNDINAMAAGRIEDKWIEFVATEFADRRGDALRSLARTGAEARVTMRRVEVHASYVWLLGGAALAWLIG
jgi:hypothetical protein